MQKLGESLLLDTSIVIEGFRNNPDVAEMLSHAGRLYLSVVAYGELYFGAIKAKAQDKKLSQLNEFMRVVNLLHMDWRTAQCYAEIRKELEAKGEPIPENDIWIAAFAKQYQVKLYARDGHFKKIEGLELLHL